MSGQRCPNCGEEANPRSAHCEACGYAIRGATNVSARAHGGIHPAAPVAFVVAGLAIGLAGTLLVSLTFGVPLGLLGGGIGVWVLERGRRFR
jgi:hypothetical protein